MSISVVTNIDLIAAITQHRLLPDGLARNAFFTDQEEAHEEDLCGGSLPGPSVKSFLCCCSRSHFWSHRTPKLSVTLAQALLSCSAGPDYVRKSALWGVAWNVYAS